MVREMHAAAVTVSSSRFYFVSFSVYVGWRFLACHPHLEYVVCRVGYFEFE